MLYGMHVHNNILEWGGGGADGGGYWAVICQNPCPCMYSIEQKHAFEHYIILTKMTPVTIQFGIKMALEYTLKAYFGIYRFT